MKTGLMTPPPPEEKVEVEVVIGTDEELFGCCDDVDDTKAAEELTVVEVEEDG